MIRNYSELTEALISAMKSKAHCCFIRTQEIYINFIFNPGYSILDDLPLFHNRGTDHLLLVPAGVHEIKADFELQIFASALRSTLPLAGERIIHAANGVVHVCSCVCTCISVKSR